MTKEQTPTTTGTIVGYARVSTDKQDEARQLSELRAHGITQTRNIYTDHAVSGAKTSRPDYDRMVDDLASGDVVVVTELDRLGRNTGHVITTIAELREKGIHVRSLADGIDSSTDMGEVMMQLLAVFAGVERRMIQRRTKSGLAEAKAQGRVGGRPPKLDAKQAALVVRLSDEGESVRSIAKTLHVSEPTIYRVLAAAK